MGNLGVRAEIDFPSWQVSLQMWQPLNFVLGRSMTGLGFTWRTLGGWGRKCFCLVSWIPVLPLLLYLMQPESELVLESIHWHELVPSSVQYLGCVTRNLSFTQPESSWSWERLPMWRGKRQKFFSCMPAPPPKKCLHWGWSASLASGKINFGWNTCFFSPTWCVSNLTI